MTKCQNCSRLQARVEALKGVLDRIDYALENIWAIDRDRLRQLIAEAATEQGEVMSDLHGMEWAELCQEAQRLRARVEALQLRAKTYEEGYNESQEAIRYHQAKVKALKAALQKISTEPGNARDCRYIASHALADIEQEKTS